MHQPDTSPRPSLYYDYHIFPFVRPPELNGAPLRHKVAIIGAGPIGLLTAINLARFGVASVVIESEAQVSQGSRAIVLTRRSLEILQQAGVAEPFMEKGLPWAHGRSFYKGREVYRMVMPHDEDDRFLPCLNIQQQYIEDYLVAAAARTGLVEIRWQTEFTDLEQTTDGVIATVDTPEGIYQLDADWLVAADGGRSAVRKCLGLKFEGESFPGNFVIADIKAGIKLPTERLCFYDPPWSPGNNVLVHREPDDIWRLDYRLPDDETPVDALAGDRLSGRIDAILEMIGFPVPWQLDWATVYSANTLTLSDYVAARVIFVGDAAHLLPIFGVRGVNTGFQDAENLAWKLAFVVRGRASRKLVQSYTEERVAAAREICGEGGRSTRFMSPPSHGFRLMRDAVLSLALSQDFPKGLMHWRTSRPHDYTTSPLNSFLEESAKFTGGIAPGEVMRNVKLGPDDYLFDHFGTGFHVIVFAPDDGLDGLKAIMPTVEEADFPLVRIVITPRPTAQAEAVADRVIADPQGLIATKYGARAGSVYLVRPDLHVAARWSRAQKHDVLEALRTAQA